MSKRNHPTFYPGLVIIFFFTLCAAGQKGSLGLPEKGSKKLWITDNDTRHQSFSYGPLLTDDRAEIKSCQPSHSSLGFGLAPERTFILQHEYLLFCVIQTELNEWYLNSQEGILMDHEKSRLINKLERLRRFLWNKRSRNKQKLYYETIDSIYFLIEKMSDLLVNSKPLPFWLQNEISEKIHKYFADILCADLISSTELSIKDLKIIAKQVIARCFTDLFRWTGLARQRISSEFLDFSSHRDLYYRRVINGSCIQFDSVENHFYHFSGRLNNKSDGCQNGIYFEITLTVTGKIDRILFELD